jgi:hypothetical protein
MIALYVVFCLRNASDSTHEENVTPGASSLLLRLSRLAHISAWV